jgi:hypothetical protein
MNNVIKSECSRRDVAVCPFWAVLTRPLLTTLLHAPHNKQNFPLTTRIIWKVQLFQEYDHPSCSGSKHQSATANHRQGPSRFITANTSIPNVTSEPVAKATASGIVCFTPLVVPAHPWASNYQSPCTPTRFLVRPNPISVANPQSRYWVIFLFIPARVQSNPRDMLSFVGVPHSFSHTRLFARTGEKYASGSCYRRPVRDQHTSGYVRAAQYPQRARSPEMWRSIFMLPSHYNTTSAKDAEFLSRSNVSLLLGYGGGGGRTIGPNIQHQILTFGT